MVRYIKTKCGLDEYYQLIAKTGILNYIRFDQFACYLRIIGSLGRKKKQTLKTIVIFELLVASAAFNLDVTSSKYINSNYLVFSETEK